VGKGVGWRWRVSLTCGAGLSASARERRGEVGPRWLHGPEEEVGQRGKKKKEREESCWAGPRGEGERFRGLERFVFFSKTFQIFSNFKFKPFFYKSFQTFKTF
jgi:hypothetical protein